MQLTTKFTTTTTREHPGQIQASDIEGAGLMVIMLSRQTEVRTITLPPAMHKVTTKLNLCACLNYAL